MKSKIKYRLITAALSVALFLSSAQPTSILAASSSTTSANDDWVDEFEGWDDDSLENAYLTYQITDWSTLEGKLITAANSIGVKIKAVNLSSRIKNLKDKIEKAVKKKNLSTDYYVQLMLAMAQSLADKSADNDPFMWQTYVDPTYADSGLMSTEKSIELALDRLLKMESTYKVRYKTAPLITEKDGKYDAILAGYMAGAGYIEKNNKYSKKNVQSYIENNPDQYTITKADGSTVTIIPLSNFPDLVNSHLNIMSVSGNGTAGYGKGGMNIPIIYQGDYANVKWGNDNIKNAGCGVASLAMVLTYLTGRSVTVNELANKYNTSAYRLAGGATKGGSLYPKAASDYGVRYVGHTKSAKVAFENLLKGNPVICSQSSGLFTKNRHFIVLRGASGTSVDDAKVWVNDPNGRRSGQRSGYSASGWLNKEFSLMKDVHRTLNSGYYIFSK